MNICECVAEILDEDNFDIGIVNPDLPHQIITYDQERGRFVNVAKIGNAEWKNPWLVEQGDLIKTNWQTVDTKKFRK